MLREELDLALQDIQKEYLEFLDDETDQGVYHTKVKEMIEGRKIRLLVNIADLKAKLPVRAKNLFHNAGEEILAFQNALKSLVLTINPDYNYDEFCIGFEGNFGNNLVTPRNLISKFLNNIVCLEGIVTQSSIIRPKLVRSVHYCPTTQKMSERKYSDFTSLNPMASAPAYPTKDMDGNLLETEYGLCVYKDHQKLTIQEMPEKAPPGQLPRAVDVICEHDLADKCQAGDRVKITGLFRCLPAKRNGYTNGVFKTILLANNIVLLNKDTKVALSRKDIANCRKISKNKNVFSLLSRSLAPSIYGHDYVKKAILCMLLGGVEKVLSSGTRLRGDINLLLIGDPSVAKSQLLRYVLGTAPRAVATTGRGSTGVGLTAAVTTDRETGDKKLEAGAMVLADRGVVCIDEFDKMTDLDRTAIHEVMEQGRITINKAGIHARLNARCSVLAAANPVYGKYNQYKPPMQNIGLQDSLLSRFDLIFVMLDVVNTDIDNIISDHVVRMHTYRAPGEPDGAILQMGESANLFGGPKESEETNLDNIPVYEKYDPLLHGNSRTKSDRIFSQKFMRVYIHIAKTLKPVLTDESSEIIAEEYARLRSHDAVQDGEARTQPVTVRTLETMIRLSTAHAKARLASHITAEDANAAIELVQFAYFKKVLEKKKRRRSIVESDSDSDIHVSDTPVQIRKKAKKVVDKIENPPHFDSVLSDSEPESEPLAVQKPGPPITNERLKLFKLLLSRVFQGVNVQSLGYKILIAKINAKNRDAKFTEYEAADAIRKMVDENLIMLADNIVFLI